jgi:hypothetical protein
MERVKIKENLINDLFENLGISKNIESYPNNFCVPGDINNQMSALIALNNYIPFRIVINEDNNKTILLVMPFCLTNELTSNRNIILDSTADNYPFILKLSPILLHSLLNTHKGIPNYEINNNQCTMTYIDDAIIIKRYIYHWNNGVILAQQVIDINENTLVPLYLFTLERRNALEITQQISIKLLNMIKFTDTNKFQISWCYKSSKQLAIIIIKMYNNTYTISINKYKYVLIKSEKKYSEIDDILYHNNDDVLMSYGSIMSDDVVNTLCQSIFCME